MESIENLLGSQAVTESETVADTDESLRQASTDNATGEIDIQVAAENHKQDYSPEKVKAELAGLAKERERIRQKEAALDEERARITQSNNTSQRSEEKTEDVSDTRQELKELRKQHRLALSNLMIDPDDVETEQQIEELENKMEDLRASLAVKSTKAATEAEQSSAVFNTVYADVHKEFPFLDVNHADVNEELNDDINTYFVGRMNKGDNAATALRKAVDKYAPAYAKQIGVQTNKQLSGNESDKTALNKLNRSSFADVRNVSRSEVSKPFTGYTPMDSILGKKL